MTSRDGFSRRRGTDGPTRLTLPVPPFQVDVSGRPYSGASA